MKDSAYKISLDINEHGSQAVLKAKKTDTGRKIYISLRAGGTPYTIAEDCYAVFTATKPDGSILYNACTIENNEIVYEFTEQTCAAVGRNRCEIKLYGLDDKLITSPRFALLVDGTVYPDELVESTDEFSALTRLVTETMRAIADANVATEEATQSAQNAAMASVNANDATTAANKAANNANNATDSANLASQKANAAADSANGASESADLAANKANAAAGAANNGANNANVAAGAAMEAAHAAKSLMVVGGARGVVIGLNDAIEQHLVGCRIFGKTTQDGTPTPDAPVELVSAGDGGYLNVNVAGKNLCDVAMIKLGEPTVMSRTETGFVFARGAFVGGTYASFAMPITKGQTITISCKGSAYQPSLVIYKDAVYGEQLASATDKGTLTYTPTENIPGAVFAVIINSKNTDCEISNIQIELGSTATEYEPYKGQSVTISTPNGLPGIPVASSGNYTDSNGQQWICDEIDFARGVYVKRIEKFTLAVADMDNTEGYPGWKNSGISEYYHEVNGVLGSMGSMSMCNIDSNPKGTVYINTLSGGNIVLIPNPKGMTQSEWKAQYPELVFELIFSIPTPIETPLSEEELAAYAALHTYKDSTTVSNDAGAWMELEYVMDAKKYIDSQISAGILAATVE